MNFKDLTIGKKIAAGYSIVLSLLAFLAIYNYLGVKQMMYDAEEVIAGNKLTALINQKEVDHLNWSANISSLLNNEDITSLNVETDDHKCDLGTWLYGPERKEAEELIPSLIPLLQKMEKPHYLLHQSAIQINKVFTQGDISLPSKILAIELANTAWVGRIKDGLLTGATSLVDVQTDPTKCTLGKWLVSAQGKMAQKNSSANLKKTWQSLLIAHDQMHASCEHIKEKLAVGNHEDAVQIFMEGTRPSLAITAKSLEKIRKDAIQDLYGMQEANDVYAYQTLPSLNLIQNLLKQIKIEIRKNIKTDVVMLQSINNTLLQVSILAVIALITGILIAFFTARGIINLLSRMVENLSQNSIEVTTVSEQTALLGLTLAEGTAEQAATIESTSASLEEISSLTKQNAENTQEADAIMKETQTAIATAEEAMKKLTVSIEEISTASSATQKIVKTIDDIAFQTNILALNAAVEAARAGQAGAGFAVVADEVRNLAMRSAEAAKNTSILIDLTLEKVSSGTDQLNVTVTSFDIAAKSSGKVTTLVHEIAAASTEQAQGVEHINKSIIEIDAVTQSNSDNAAHSAATSTELANHAAAMNEIVHDLKKLVGDLKKSPEKPLDKNRVSNKNRQSIRQHQRHLPPVLAATKKTHSTKKSSPEEVIPFDDFDDDFEDF